MKSMGLVRPCLVALAFLALTAEARALPPLPTACATSEDYLIPDEPFPHVAAALAHEGALNVLAIGSASTVGVASRLGQGVTPGGSFPYQMVAALRPALPQVPVQLTVMGGRGLTAAEMVPILGRALKQRHYQLVLWQTGTVEAVRGERPDAMQEALQQGADMVRAAGADLVLIDLQFSRFLRANADLEPYEASLQQVATMPGVVLFHRFDLMQDWAHGGQIDLERTSRAQRADAIALLNRCLGDVLARFVLNGAELKQ